MLTHNPSCCGGHWPLSVVKKNKRIWHNKDRLAHRQTFYFIFFFLFHFPCHCSVSVGWRFVKIDLLRNCRRNLVRFSPDTEDIGILLLLLLFLLLLLLLLSMYCFCCCWVCTVAVEYALMCDGVCLFSSQAPWLPSRGAASPRASLEPGSTRSRPCPTAEAPSRK